jgi:FG-GAP-like repeat
MPDRRPRRPHPRRRRAGSALAALLALGLLLGAAGRDSARGQDTQRLLRDVVRVETELETVLPFDLNGDGRADLVVVEADRGHSREVRYTVHVLRQGERGFEPLPGATQELPLHVSLLDVATFRGGPALALLTPGEVALWPWRGGRFAPEAAIRTPVQSLFPVPNGGLKTGLRWTADLEGDGLTELLIPRFDGLDVLAQAQDGSLQLRAQLRVRANARMLDWFKRELVAYDLPSLAVMQVDGQGWQDVMLFQNGELSVFLLDDTLDGGEVAPTYVRDLQPPKPFDPKVPRDPPMRLMAAQDLNADGHFDLLFSKNAASDSQFNTRTSVLVFYGRAGANGAPIDFAQEPDQVYFTEGFSLPLVLDINNDGRKDLVLVNVEIGFWNVIKALISRSVNAQAAFYRMPADGHYPRDPQQLETYEVTFSLGRYSHQPIADFGDLNGDGLPDLLLSVDKERLGIHWGRKDGVWASAPDVTIKDFIPINGKRMLVRDLDGDGRDDLIFAYGRDDIRAMPEVNHSFTVLRSRYGAPRAALKVARP